MSARLLPTLRQRFFDPNGEPMPGGLLYSYLAGTTTPTATYTDQAGTIPNTNPVVLDANGEAEVWLLPGSYKFVLCDAEDVPQWTVDNVSAASGFGNGSDASAAQAAADAAAASASSVFSSVAAAAGSAAAALISEGNAGASATAAALSASNASAYAIAASNSADLATNKANDAYNSAQAAAAADVPNLLTTKGDIVVRNSSMLSRLPVGTNGQVLQADSTQTSGVQWATVVTDIIGQTALTAPAVDDSILTYDLSATANRKIALSDLLKVISLLAADASPDGASDYLLSYDSSASAAKKILINTLKPPPTVQKFTSGSGTYTRPANVIYIRVRLVGGGGGGAGSGTAAGTTPGNGSASTFGTSLLSAGGGGGASPWSATFSSVAGGTGGTSSLGTGPVGLALTGSQGDGGEINNSGGTSIWFAGGRGAGTPFGGGGAAGAGGQVGVAPAANTGGGGGGGGASGQATAQSGSGGGSGGYVEAFIFAPSATYAYAIGSAGSAGGAGASGVAGGAGASGIIVVEEYY